MKLNGVSLIERQNNPGVLSKVALRVNFISNGELTDPYEISAVSIFPATADYYPSSILNTNIGEIDYNATSNILMNFANSAALTTDIAYDTSNYPNIASGIFRSSEGSYIVVLSQNTTGLLNLSGINTEIPNACSSTGDYIDVWTVRLTEDGDLTTIINNFHLRNNSFLWTTEPLRFTPSVRLVNNKITLGSKVDLKVEVNVNIENRNIEESVRNLLKVTSISNPSLEIVKLNEDRNLASRVTVSSFSDTTDLVTATSDNTLVFQWDTDALRSHPALLAGTLGSMTGVYDIRVKYTVIDQTFISQPMAIVVR